jgi:RNA polymerase sigma-70 factor, ECF subfamily
LAVKTPEQQVTDLKNHKAGSMEKVIELFTGPLLATAIGLGFSRDSAEELVHDTFVAFLQAIDRFESRSQLKTYLFSILYHKASDMRRHRIREIATENMEEIFEQRFDAKGMWISPPRGPEDDVQSKELQEWIDRCAEGLALNQRMAFFLKEVDHQSTEDICKILEVSPTNLGVLLFRAKLKLRDCLEKKWVNKQI